MTLLHIPVGLQLLSVATLTVATAGTPQQLPSTRCKRVVIQTDEENGESVIAVGDSAVDALSDPPDCIAMLYASQRDNFEVDNADKLWIDSTGNGAKISYAIFG